MVVFRARTAAAVTVAGENVKGAVGSDDGIPQAAEAPALALIRNTVVQPMSIRHGQRPSPMIDGAGVASWPLASAPRAGCYVGGSEASERK